MFAQTSASRSCPKYDPVSEYKKKKIQCNAAK